MMLKQNKTKQKQKQKHLSFTNYQQLNIPNINLSAYTKGYFCTNAL